MSYVRQVIEHFNGVIRGNKICCPFHEEKTPSLNLYDDTNSWYCFGCGLGGDAIQFVIQSEQCSFPEAVKIYKDVTNDDETYTLNEVMENVVGQYFDEEVHKKIKAETGLDSKGYRGIRTEISKPFGVRYSYNDDGDVSSTFYPITQNYNLSGYKVRVHPKNFANPYGEVGKDCELFGQFKFKTFTDTVLIVGGEHDALAAFQMLSDNQKNKQYNPVAVVSPTIGESAAYKQIQQQYPFFNQFKKIVVCMDSDKAGEAATQDIIDVLPRGRVHIMQMRRKDPNAYIWDKETGRDVSFQNEFNNDFWAAKPYTPPGVKSASEGIAEIADELRKPRITLPPYMHVMQDMMGGGIIQGRIGNVIADTSCGKCFAKGTQVLMIDGTTSKVEDIKIGDKLMGADGTYRTVMTTVSGVDQMYRIDQVDGISYTVNSEHILSLRAGYDCPSIHVKKGDVVNISVKDWLLLGNKAKRSLKGYKANLSKLGEHSFVAHPYLIGLWLADGASSAARITIGNKDTEIKEYVRNVAIENDWNISIPPSCDREGSQTFSISGGFRTILSGLNLIDNKHIPLTYKMSSYADRLQLLAGILDGDGYLKSNCFEIVQKSEVMRDDIIFLARSLGLRATFAEKFSKCQNFAGGVYYRISISGDVDKLPMKLPRKMAVSKSELRRNLNTSISVTPVGTGEYYGFSVDGDHLFCLKDMTVTHNSTHVNRMVYHWIFNSPVTPTIVSLEATASQYMLEMLSIHMQTNLMWKMQPEELIVFLETEEGRRISNELAYKPNGEPRFFIIDDRAGSIKDMEVELEMLFRKYDSKLFVIDVLTDLLRGSNEQHSEDHMNFQRNMAKNGVTLINVLHTRKPQQSQDGKIRKVTEYDALGTGSFVQSAHYNIVLNRDKLAEDILTKNTTEVDLPKCRGGKTGAAGRWYYDFETSTCHDLNDWLYSSKSDYPELNSEYRQEEEPVIDF